MKTTRKIVLSIALPLALVLGILATTTIPGTMASATVPTSTEDILARLGIDYATVEVITDENGALHVFVPQDDSPLAIQSAQTFGAQSVQSPSAQAAQIITAPQGGIWAHFTPQPFSTFTPLEILYLDRDRAVSAYVLRTRSDVKDFIAQELGLGVAAPAIVTAIEKKFALKYPALGVTLFFVIQYWNITQKMETNAFGEALNEGGGVKVTSYKDNNGYVINLYSSWKSTQVSDEPFADCGATFYPGIYSYSDLPESSSSSSSGC